MRLIGHLEDEKAARTFGDYLYVQGIENHLEHEKPDGWGIWINDEDKLEEAAQLLTGRGSFPNLDRKNTTMLIAMSPRVNGPNP